MKYCIRCSTRLAFLLGFFLLAFESANPPAFGQDSKIVIKDEAEFNAYRLATSQSNRSVRIAALEGFLQTYPKSVVKLVVLNALLDIYQEDEGLADNSLDTANHLLELDPQSMRAVCVGVRSLKTRNRWVDAAKMAQRGLALSKPSGLSDAEWENETSIAYPLFHSALAYKALNWDHDFPAAIAEFNIELQLIPAANATSVNADSISLALVTSDIISLANAYTDSSSQDLVKAIWFYARAWNLAPLVWKQSVGARLEYWYKTYRGTLVGIDDVKRQTENATFPPPSFRLVRGAQPAEIVHDVVARTANLGSLSSADRTFILKYGSKEDADKMRSAMNSQASQWQDDRRTTASSAVKGASQCNWPIDFNRIRDAALLQRLSTQDFAQLVQQGGIPIESQIAAGEAQLAQISGTLPNIEADIRGISHPTITQYNFGFNYDNVCKNNPSMDALLASECQHVNVENARYALNGTLQIMDCMAGRPVRADIGPNPDMKYWQPSQADIASTPNPVPRASQTDCSSAAHSSGDTYTPPSNCPTVPSAPSNARITH